MTKEMKEMSKKELMQWIDDADYDTMLNHWRFADLFDPMFDDDEVEAYFKKKLIEKNNV